jgi:hypothetical protein
MNYCNLRREVYFNNLEIYLPTFHCKNDYVDILYDFVYALQNNWGPQR